MAGDISWTFFGHFSSNVLVLIQAGLLFSLIHVSQQCDIKMNQTDHVVVEGNMAAMTCRIENEAAKIVSWATPRGTTVSNRCQSLDPKYKVSCVPDGKYTWFNLEFKAVRADQGKFSCHCDLTKEHADLKVQVRLTSIKAACTVKATGEPCNVSQLTRNDVLKFTARTNCTDPKPSLAWTMRTGKPVTRDPIPFQTQPCTGQNQAGLVSAVSEWYARWGDLNTTSELVVVGKSELGVVSLWVYIQDYRYIPHDKKLLMLVLFSLIGVVILACVITIIARKIRNKRDKKKYGAVGRRRSSMRSVF